MKALGKEESPVSEHRTQFNTVVLNWWHVLKAQLTGCWQPYYHMRFIVKVPLLD